MTSLVDDLLAVSRVTRGLIRVDNLILDVKQVVADTAEHVRPLIEACGNHLAMHRAPGKLFVLGDHKRLVRVLSNLLDNAAKYTTAGGDIVLKIAATTNEIALLVSDDGICMKRKSLENVFEIFLRVDRTDDRSQGALRIGLVLVKSLAERPQGTVTAYSARANRGSEFVFSLPGVKQFEVPVDAKMPAPLGLAKRLRISVVDANVEAARRSYHENKMCSRINDKGFLDKNVSLSLPRKPQFFEGRRSTSPW